METVTIKASGHLLIQMITCVVIGNAITQYINTQSEKQKKNV